MNFEYRNNEKSNDSVLDSLKNKYSPRNVGKKDKTWNVAPNKFTLDDSTPGEDPYKFAFELGI